jgi:GNAT superfamily N-acetyltransferase
MNGMIRLAENGDREGILVLARQFAISFKVDDEEFMKSLHAIFARPDARLYVAESSGGIVGYLLGFMHPTFYSNGPVGWIEEIMVEESNRRNGFGRGLAQKFEEWARSNGCRLVALATRRASEFYRAMGYEESATYFRKLL